MSTNYMRVLQKFVLMLGPDEVSLAKNDDLTRFKGNCELNLSDFL